MCREYVATADEANEIRIWSSGSFHNISTYKIPSTFDSEACFEFADGANSHQNDIGESGIIELRFVKENKDQWYLLVLESRGCVHIIDPKQSKIFQLHALNIGQQACFDIEYEEKGIRLYSFDVGLEIKIFSRSGTISLEEYRKQVQSQADNLGVLGQRGGTIKPKVSFVQQEPIDFSTKGDMSPESSPGSPDMARRATFRASLNSKKKNVLRAVMYLNPVQVEPQTSVSAGVMGWGFLLVKKINYFKESIRVSIQYSYRFILIIESY